MRGGKSVGAATVPMHEMQSHLEISHMPPDYEKAHFPNIHARLLELGIAPYLLVTTGLRILGEAEEHVYDDSGRRGIIETTVNNEGWFQSSEDNVAR